MQHPIVSWINCSRSSGSVLCTCNIRDPSSSCDLRVFVISWLHLLDRQRASGKRTNVDRGSVGIHRHSAVLIGSEHYRADRSVAVEDFRGGMAEMVCSADAGDGDLRMKRG